MRRLLGHCKVTVRGEWWLWVWCGRWSLSLKDSPTRITPSSSLRRKQEALRALDGQKLRQAIVNPRTGATVLVFDLGAQLRLGGSVSPDGEIYALYEPTESVLLIRTDGQFSHELGAKPRRWRSMRAAT